MTRSLITRFGPSAWLSAQWDLYRELFDFITTPSPTKSCFLLNYSFSPCLLWPLFITFFKTVTLANLFSPAHLLYTQRYLIFSTQLTQLKGMDTMFKDTDELSSEDLLKFSQQQDTYLIIFIRVSRVIKVATPLKPTPSKIFITSSSFIINSLNSRSMPGKRNCKESNTHFSLYFISTIIYKIRFSKRCKIVCTLQHTPEIHFRCAVMAHRDHIYT